MLSFSDQPHTYFVWELLPFMLVAVCGGAAGAALLVAYKWAEQYRQKTSSGKIIEAGTVVLIVACLSFVVPLYVLSLLDAGCQQYKRVLEYLSRYGMR